MEYYIELLNYTGITFLFANNIVNVTFNFLLQYDEKKIINYSFKISLSLKNHIF